MNKYWTYHINKNKWHQVVETHWQDSAVDHKRERERRIFETKQQAEAALKQREGITL